MIATSKLFQIASVYRDRDLGDATEQTRLAYARWFGLDSLLCTILYLYFLVKNMVHTNHHLSMVSSTFERLISLATTRKVDFKPLHRKALSKAFGLFEIQARNLIMSMHMTFGVDSFMTHTNDFDDDDALGALISLIQCLRLWVNLDSIVFDMSKTWPITLTDWLSVRILGCCFSISCEHSSIANDILFDIHQGIHQVSLYSRCSHD